MTQSDSGTYTRLNPQYSRNSRSAFLGRQSAFIWLVILSVFVISAFFETQADVRKSEISQPNKVSENQKLADITGSIGYKHLTPDICANFLAGSSRRASGPRYSTYGLGKNPVPANLPSAQIAPPIGFEIAPQLPAIPNLPPRGVAGWVDIDPATGQTLINGRPVGNQTGMTENEIVEACLAMMSDK